MDTNRATLPEYTGIFIVYRCVLEEESHTVDLKEILYIGKALNIRETVNGLHDTFIAEVKDREDLCYSYAEIPDIHNLDIIENALVFAQKPRLNKNEELKTEYNFDKPAQFLIEGSCALLKHVNYTIQ